MSMNSITTKSAYIPNPSKSWSKKDEEVNRFFVYILRLEDGRLYIGQTRELRERMLEHKDGTITSTAGKKPKLRYFEILPTRQSAMSRENELKEKIRSNRREIYRMISDFRELISEVDLS
jgi:predicted GIY-YIG superfamily endonuclease